MDTGGLTNAGDADKLIQICLLIAIRLWQELGIFICNDDDVRKKMMRVRGLQLSLTEFLVVLLNTPATRLLKQVQPFFDFLLQRPHDL